MVPVKSFFAPSARVILNRVVLFLKHLTGGCTIGLTAPDKFCRVLGEDQMLVCIVTTILTTFVTVLQYCLYISVS